MIDRRDWLIGAACLIAAGGAEALRPRREIKLLGDAKLEDIVPTDAGKWREEAGGGVVVPLNKGSLADRLYSQQLQRIYGDGTHALPLMLLIAYGASQSDQLQLHRPEVCYPAVGFEIIARRLSTLTLAPGMMLPSVELTAERARRQEDILYWTRLGEDFPRSGSEQRGDRLRAALRGEVGDGVLFRVSTIRPEGGEPQFARLTQFVQALIPAMAAQNRPALIGTQRARALARG